MSFKNKNLVIKAFSQALQELRKEKKLTQDDLAHLMGIERPYISQIERSIKQPSLVMMYKLATALKMSPIEMIQKVDKIYNELLDNK